MGRPGAGAGSRRADTVPARVQSAPEPARALERRVRRRRRRAPAPPASTPRWSRPSRAPAWRSSRARRWRSRPATGRRAGWRPRSPPTTTSSCTSSRHARRGPRRLPARDAVAHPLRGGARPRARAGASCGIPSTAPPTATLQLSLEGGHTRRRVVHAGGSATGRHLTARLSELVTAARRASRCTSAPPRSRCGWRTAAASASSPSRRAIPAARPCSAPAAPRRCGAHDQPARRDRRRAVARARGRAPRSPTWSSCSSIPPRSRVDGRARRLPRHRGGARRGRAARDADGERFVDELAPRDEVARAIDARLRAGGACSSTCAASTRAAFPNIVESLAGAGLDPRRDLDPGRARGALHDRRRRDRRATAARRCPACTRSASAPAPACTARTGWPRTRSRSASCSAGARRSRRCDEPVPAAGRGPPPGAARSGRPPRRRARRCGAAPGRCATPRASSAWRQTRTRWHG